jgi:hypothetical protein
MVPMASARRSLIGLICLAIIHTGCAGRSTLPVEEMPKLDGFRAGEKRSVLDCRGAPLTFTAETPLLLILQTGREREATYGTIAVREGVFRGTTPEGRRIEIDLEKVERIEMIHPPSTDTTLTALAIGAAAVAIVLIVWAVVVIASPEGSTG